MQDQQLEIFLDEIIQKLSEIDELCFYARTKIYNLKDMIWKRALNDMNLRGDNESI